MWLIRTMGRLPKITVAGRPYNIQPEHFPAFPAGNLFCDL